MAILFATLSHHHPRKHVQSTATRHLAMRNTLTWVMNQFVRVVNKILKRTLIHDYRIILFIIKQFYVNV